MSGLLARRAPAVVYPLVRSRDLAALLAGICLLGGAVLAAWVALGTRMPLREAAAVAVGLWLAAAVGGVHFWRLQPLGALRWDGQCWALLGPLPDTDVRTLFAPPVVFLDLQSHLWVQVAPAQHRRVWLWLERSAQPERWMDLRRAVYSRAKPGAGPDASAPADSRGRET